LRGYDGLCILVAFCQGEGAMNTTFGIGNVLASGFRIWARNFVPFMLITALIYAPVLIWGISTIQGQLDDDQVLAIVRFEKYSPILVLLLNILVSAALTYGVVMELRGQRASLGACIVMGLKRFLPALGTTLLMSLCFAGVVLCAAFPFVILTMAGGVMGAVLGAISFGIACLWILSMLYVAPQASVIEHPGVMGALGRSRALTQGHKLAIAILTILIFGLGAGSQVLIELLTLPNLAMYVYIGLVSLLILGSISAVMASVAYYFLRAEKEGTSVDELAAVFG
jgi:hypothetical protein